MKDKDFKKHIISIINGQGNMKQILCHVKKQGTEEQYKKAVNAIQRNSRYRKMLSSLYTNRNVNDIFTASYIPSLIFTCGNSKENIFKDVSFMVEFLLGYKDIIGDFYSKKAQFESLFLKGDLQNAEQILDEIYNTTGTSFWYIEMKLLLLNNSDYEEYRSYYESVKSLAENDLIRNHIRLIKRRVNMRTSENDFCEFYKKYFADDSSNQDYNYYRIFVDFMYTESLTKLSELQMSNLVAVMHNFTLIDTVLFVERFLITMVGIQKLPEYQSLYNEFKNQFNGDNVERGDEYQEVKELFCQGEYIACCLRCEELLTRNSDRFEITDIYVKSLLVLDRSSGFDDCTLSTLVTVLISCYLKKDGSTYGTSFMDKSNQILRALSSFNGYYELLNIISNTMYVKSTIEHPYWDVMIWKRPFHNSEYDLLKNNIPNEGIISCDWSYSFYKKSADIQHITRDKISESLKSIRDQRNTSVSIDQESTGMQRFFLEEAIVIAFGENTERKQYLQAVQLYVDVLVEDILLVTRCDIDLLCNELTEEKCALLHSDPAFYIFAATTDLNKQFRDTHSQTLFDSFHAILAKYCCNVPSDIINNPLENKKQFYKFLELCCDEKVLTQSPSDLYGKENLQEQERILNYLYSSTHQKRFNSKLNRVKADLAEFNVRNMTQSVHLPKAKINTDWLSVEYDSDIASAYDQLQGLSYEQISKDDNLFNVYKVMFYRCKEKYLTQVNKQLGTFIRHGVFINTMVEFLEKYGLFFPSGDKQEDENRLVNSQFLQEIPIQDRVLVFEILQTNCLRLFKSIETVISSIFFTSEKISEEYTSIYIESKELKERILGLGKPKDEVEFIETTKRLLDKYIEEGLPNMGNMVTKKLHDIFNRYVSLVRQDIPEQHYTKLPIDKLMNDFPEEIVHIGEWFQIINDSKQQCSIDGYLKERNEKYQEICFNLSTNSSTICLSDLILLDIIVENLIRNVEEHAGFGTNHKKAETEVSIQISLEKKRIHIISKNRLNRVDKGNLEKAIAKINMIVPQVCSSICNSEAAGVLGGEKSSSSLQIHGVGLYNLGGMICKACKDPYIFAEQDGGRFVIEVAFDYGGFDE